MNSRKRALTILEGRQPDQVPWFGDLDYWALALIGRGQKPPGFHRYCPEYIDWHLDLRYVLGVADQVPPSGLESRVRRVAELVEEYGSY